jgi:hypothetical protein
MQSLADAVTDRCPRALQLAGSRGAGADAGKDMKAFQVKIERADKSLLEVRPAPLKRACWR